MARALALVGVTIAASVATSADAAAAATAPPIAFGVEEVTPFLSPSAHGLLFVDVQQPRKCTLAFRGPHGLRSGPYTIAVKQRFVQYKWRLPSKVAPGKWTGRLTCRAHGRARAGTVVQPFHVSGGSHHHQPIVQPGTLKVAFFAAAPSAQPTGAPQEVNSGRGGFDSCECTGWAYANRADVYNYAVNHGQPAGGWNGGVWGDRAAAAGEVVGDFPKAGGLVSFHPGVAGADRTFGHVGYVNWVDPTNPLHFRYSWKSHSDCGTARADYVHTSDLYAFNSARQHGETFIYGPPGSSPPGGGTPGPPAGGRGFALGGSSGSGVPLGTNADGRLETFLVGADSQLYTSYQTQANGGWSGFVSLGGSWPAGDSIGEGSNADGRMELFMVGGNSQLYTNYQTQVNGGWSGWQSFGGTWSSHDSIGVGVNADGRLEIYLVGQDGHLYTKYQTQVNGGWSGWVSFGGDWPAADTVAVGHDANGAQDLFLVGKDGHLYTNYQVQVNGGWSGWQSLGGTWSSADSIGVGSNADGRLEVFMVGQDHQLYTNYEHQVNGAFGGWSSLGGSWQNSDWVGVGSNQDGRLEVFLVGDDRRLYTNYQDQVNGGFHGFVPLGGGWRNTDSVGVGRNADGRLQLYLVGDDTQLYTNYQTQVNNGWFGWVSHGGSWPAASR